MLASALGRHVHNRTFEEFEQTLLYTFAPDIAGYAGIVAFAGNLVDFIDEYMPRCACSTS